MSELRTNNAFTGLPIGTCRRQGTHGIRLEGYGDALTRAAARRPAAHRRVHGHASRRTPITFECAGS